MRSLCSSVLSVVHLFLTHRVLLRLMRLDAMKIHLRHL